MIVAVVSISRTSAARVHLVAVLLVHSLRLARRLITTRWIGCRRPVCVICATAHHRLLRRRRPRREAGARENNAYLNADGDWIPGGRDFDGEYD